MESPYLGAIVLWSAKLIPSGWLPCDGRKILIAQNQALYALLGSTYGGDNASYFCLPDLRGRFPVGIGGAAPGVPGLNLGTLGGATTATVPLPAHTHAATTQAQSSLKVGNPGTGQSVVPGGYLTASPGTTTTAAAIYQSAAPATTTAVQGVETAATTTVAPAGVASAQVNVTNPHIGLQFIIAVQGLFPN